MQLDTSENSWKYFLSQAKKALNSKATWVSPIEGRGYTLKEANNDKVVIERLDGGKTSSFGKAYYDKRIKEINDLGFKKRKNRSGSVAQISTLVYLHPQLEWSNNKDKDIVIITNTNSTYFENNISNDDINDKQTYARRIRRGQAKFRKELFRRYGKTCCVSGISIDEVIDACHIEPHSIKGNNDIYNGLLLRTDIHNLFDEEFLFINPQTYIIHIHPRLKKTGYWQYNGKQIVKMKNGQGPDEKYLKVLWDKKKF